MINLSEIQTKNASIWHKICPFPVGYVYLSNSNTSPASLFGGTWSQLTDGRFLRPDNSWRSLGGYNEHRHWQTVGFHGPEGAVLYASDGAQLTESRVNSTGYVFNTDENATYGSGIEVFRLHNSGPRRQDATYVSSNIPAYSTCYTWYRTA